MKEQFRDYAFTARRRELLELCLAIIEEYQYQDITITLRQLYYQLVARGHIDNLQKEYKKLGDLVTKARYAGMIDWEAIEDRVRRPNIPLTFTGLEQLARSAVNWYELNRWEGQENYCEIFTEKDALSSVIAPIANKWQVALCVNRGYASATAMYDTACRIMHHWKNCGMQPVIIYIGDHDPSGLDMIRDMQDRLTEFCTYYAPPAVTVIHLALTMDQVDQYNPPPNPAKLSDSRADAYIAEHGKQSWEVDALPPDVLHDLIDGAIIKLVDRDKMRAVKDQEEKDKGKVLEWGELV